MEERGLTKENTGQLLLDRTQRRTSDGSPFVPRSRGLFGIRQAAQGQKGDGGNSVRHVSCHKCLLKTISNFCDFGTIFAPHQ